MRIVAPAAALVAATTVTACASSESTGTSSTFSHPAPNASTFPSPSGAQTRDLLAGLHALGLPHPDAADRLIRNSRVTCASLMDGTKMISILKATQSRFSYDDAPEVTAQTATMIVSVVSTSFCQANATIRVSAAAQRSR